ncbi:unnamed protein product, partial [marine sediment metagenome]
MARGSKASIGISAPTLHGINSGSKIGVMSEFDELSEIAE